MSKPRFIVLPREFRGQTIDGLDLTKIKNCYGVVAEVTDAPEPPLQHWIFANIVEWVAKAGLPCFIMVEFDPIAVYEDLSNGGTTHFDRWRSLIEHKELDGAFLKITNTTMQNGERFPSTNMALIIEEVLDMWRDVLTEISPKRITREKVMIMSDVKTISQYTHNESVPTQLARELWLAPCDIHRSDPNGITRLSDLAALDHLYADLDLIKLNGEVDSDQEQDSLFAKKPWGHYWAKEFYQIAAGTLSGGGEAIVGIMEYYGTREELEDWCEMSINVNTDDPYIPPEEEPVMVDEVSPEDLDDLVLKDLTLCDKVELLWKWHSPFWKKDESTDEY